MITFPNDQINKINKTFMKIHLDILKMMRKAHLSHALIKFKTSEIEGFDDKWLKEYIGSEFYLKIADGDLSIQQPNTTRYYFTLSYIRKKKIFVMSPEDDNNIFLRYNIVRNYPQNRNRIYEQIMAQRHNQLSSEFDDVYKKANASLREEPHSEVSIEFNFPESIDKHQLEVTKENGYNIGVIDFGDKTIKIITSGDIVLVEKDKVDKLKQKKPLNN